MDEAIIRTLRGDATPEEFEQVARWRATSAANEEEYKSIEAIWIGLGPSDIPTTPPDPSHLLRNAEKRGRSTPTRPFRQPGRVFFPLAAAAVVALSLVGSGLLRMGPSELPALEALQVYTEAETAMVHLSDGSVVHLAPHTSLEVYSVAGQRRVRLVGRAFFGVMGYGQEWPFVVEGPHGSVKVLGTRFEFNSADAEARVVVLDGRVALEGMSGIVVEVGPGQVGRAVESDPTPSVALAEDIEASLSWMGKALVFHETPLTQVAREIESRLGASIELRGTVGLQQTISGGFEDQSFEDVVSTICRVIEADCVIEASLAVITTR